MNRASRFVVLQSARKRANPMPESIVESQSAEALTPGIGFVPANPQGPPISSRPIKGKAPECRSVQQDPVPKTISGAVRGGMQVVRPWVTPSLVDLFFAFLLLAAFG